MLAVSMTWRWREMRLIEAGPDPVAIGHHVGELHGPALGRRHSAWAIPADPCGTVLGAHVHFVLLAAFVVVGDLQTADENVERGGDVLHAHAEVGRLVAVDADAELRACRR